MRIFLFDEFSEGVGNKGMGYILAHTPLEGDIIMVSLEPYIVLHRSFHLNTNGEHELYLTVEPARKASA